MNIEAQCGECSKKFVAPEKLAGKQVKCPACSAAITIPRLELPPDALTPVDDPLNGLLDGEMAGSAAFADATPDPLAAGPGGLDAGGTLPSSLGSKKAKRRGSGGTAWLERLRTHKLATAVAAVAIYWVVFLGVALSSGGFNLIQIGIYIGVGAFLAVFGFLREPFQRPANQPPLGESFRNSTFWGKGRSVVGVIVAIVLLGITVQVVLEVGGKTGPEGQTVAVLFVMAVVVLPIGFVLAAIVRRYAGMYGVFGGAYVGFFGVFALVSHIILFANGGPEPVEDVPTNEELAEANRAPMYKPDAAPSPSVSSPPPRSVTPPPSPLETRSLDPSAAPNSTGPLPDVTPKEPSPPKVWAFTPDPPAEEFRLANGRQFSIPFPDKFGNTEAYLSSRPSRFVAVSSGMSDDTVCEVWNMETVQVAGRITGDRDGRDPWRLSPDGRYLAAEEGLGEIGVWSFESGQLVGTFSDDETDSLRHFDFGPSDQLPMLVNEFDERKVVVWDLKSKQRIGKFPVAHPLVSNQPLTISPTGKYLATVATNLHVYELPGGEEVGRLPVPRVTPGRGVDCAAASFSPDGSELVAMIPALRKARLVCWDLKRGEVVVDKEVRLDDPALLPATVGRQGVSILQWLASNAGWLLNGVTILDRNTARIVWQFSDHASRTALGLLDGQHLLVMPRPTATRGDRAALGSVPITLDTMQTAANTGGTSADQSTSPGPDNEPDLTAEAAPEIDRLREQMKARAGISGPLLPKTSLDYARLAHVDLISGNDAAIGQRLRWFPGARRPVIGLRWGLGVQPPGTANAMSMPGLLGLAEITGPAGPAIAAQLQQRADAGKFGNWPAGADPRLRQIGFLGLGKPPELLDSAREWGLSAAVIIRMNSRRVGVAGRNEMSMTVELFDVLAGKAVWTSSPLSSRQILAAQRTGADPAGEFVQEVLKQVDQQFVLAPMPALKPEHVKRRLDGLLKDGPSAAENPDKLLPVLAEVRCYQSKQLLSAPEASAYYDRIIGAGKGQVLSGDDAAARRAVLEAWLE